MLDWSKLLHTNKVKGLCTGNKDLSFCKLHPFAKKQEIPGLLHKLLLSEALRCTPWRFHILPVHLSTQLMPYNTWDRTRHQRPSGTAVTRLSSAQWATTTVLDLICGTGTGTDITPVMHKGPAGTELPHKLPCYRFSIFLCEMGSNSTPHDPEHIQIH